jgi:hypothetical protein
MPMYSCRSSRATCCSRCSTPTCTQPVVTPTILAEVERSLITDFVHLDPSRLRTSVEQMAQVLALNCHPDADIRAKALVGVNAKDRRVAAIAIAAHTDLIVTNDRRLRREINALGSAIRAVTNFEFALLLLTTKPDRVSEVIDTLVSKRTRRALSRDELLGQLALSFPKFIAGFRAYS